MTETHYASMLQAKNKIGIQNEEIAKHLRCHLGKEFLPSKSNVAMLCKGHAEVYIDSVMHIYKDCREEEKVEYSIKAIDVEIANQLSRLLQSRRIDLKNAVRIYCVSGGDHGEIAFQFGATVTVETTTERIDFGASVCEVLCQTDSDELLK